MMTRVYVANQEAKRDN